MEVRLYLTITDGSASTDICSTRSRADARTSYKDRYVLFQALNQQCSAEDDQDSQNDSPSFLSLVYLTQPHNGQL